MDNTKIAVSLENCKELRNTIINNPELPLVIFAGEDTWKGEHSYSFVEDVRVEIDELAKYGDYYVDREDYRERMYEDIGDEYNIDDDAALEKELDRRMEKVEFTKAIIIYAG